MRRPTPAGTATATPPVTLTITPDDIERARERFRKHAPREMWGLLEAPEVAKPA
jgi:hypothetical protein